MGAHPCPNTITLPWLEINVKIPMESNAKERIWQIVHQIPKGNVASYGQIANLAGLPGYARYVGHVLKNLPAGSKLPWHRVVNSKGAISFAVGTSEYLRQKARLEQEGIVFIDGRFSMARYRWNQDEA